MKHYNNKVAKIIVTYVLYAIVIGGIALIISGFCNSAYITVNWVKLLIGGAILLAVFATCDWLFPKKTAMKKENRDEYSKR